MSANSTAIHGQSNNVGLLGAAAVLSAVVAVGALGFVIGRSVATTTADRPAAGPVVDSTSVAGPRGASQKALARHYAAIAALAAQRAAAIAAELNLTIADPKETGAPVVVSAPLVSAPVGTALAGQYENWIKAQSMAIGTDFPDMFQRHADMTAAAYGGSDFAGQYDLWLKAQAMAAGSDFPDWFERVTINTGTYGLDGYGGSDFAGQYEAWLKAQAAAEGSSFPDYFQRHEAPATGGSGGRSVRLAQ